MKKVYVVDTNVLISNPNFLLENKNNNILIPFIVLEELDRLKTNPLIGHVCRRITKQIEEHRQLEDLVWGCKLYDGRGVLRIARPINPSSSNLDLTIPDNHIIQTVLNEKRKASRDDHILLSNDINVRIKADIHGIDAEGCEAVEQVVELGSGQIEMTVSSEEIDRVYAQGKIEQIEQLDPNQFATLSSSTNPKQSALVRSKGESWEKIKTKFHQLRHLDIKPRNKEQLFALNLLLDPSVSVVTLAGRAGTGKTVLALAAALTQIGYPNLEEGGIYDRILVTTPVVPIGKEIGFLPGTLEDKMMPWLAPLQDNLKFLFGYQKQMYEDFVENGLIEIESISYLRGRSLENCFIIIDEAQNCTVHELKTILTRVGKNAKIVFTGDFEQIDNPSIGKLNNGLVVCAEKFREYNFAGHVTLTKCERSIVSEVAAQIL